MKALTLLAAPCCAPGAPPLSSDAAGALAARFKALADPTRVAIVNCLAGSDEVCVCELVDAFDLSQPTISHHLRILRDAGLVEAERRGTWAFYRLVPEAIDALRGALSPVAQPPSTGRVAATASS
jgi:ArsR family transcriptional regulator